MKITQIAEMRLAYDAAVLNTNINPKDHMYKTGESWYWSVGVSAIDVIGTALASSSRNKISRVLDFGCGYGRVSRHLRAFFPGAEILYCDIMEDAAAFCAREFNGQAIVSTTDFGRLNLPTGIDLVWVGSVFTHMDFQRMQVLLAALHKSLSPRGVVVATFHGRRALEIAIQQPYIADAKWRSILVQVEIGGAGYEPYGSAGLEDWGISVTSVGKVAELSAAISDSRLILYTEAGWANHRDVAAWEKAA